MCLLYIGVLGKISVSKMAEAHAAVAFSFSVTNEGVQVHVSCCNSILLPGYSVVYCRLCFVALIYSVKAI